MDVPVKVAEARDDILDTEFEQDDDTQSQEDATELPARVNSHTLIASVMSLDT